MTCVNAGAAIHAGDVSLVFSRSDVHETCPVTALAVRAFRYPHSVKAEPQGQGADPAEEHLHEPRCADESAQDVAHED